MPVYDVPQMQAMATEIAMSAGISVSLFLRLITQESHWDPNIINPVSGCTGLCQLHPRYYGKNGEDLTDPRINMTLGADALAMSLVYHRGSWFHVLIDWSFGFGNVSELKKAWGDDWAMHLPDETKSMIDIVLFGDDARAVIAMRKKNRNR